ncbi:hypothetical protein ACJX0J_011574, partial [Zea mays]
MQPNAAFSFSQSFWANIIIIPTLSLDFYNTIYAVTNDDKENFFRKHITCEFF